MSKLFESIVKQEEARQHEIDLKNAEERKKKQQEKENKFKSKKLKADLGNEECPKWDFSDKPTFDFPAGVSQKAPKQQELQKDKLLRVKDIRGHTKEVKCAGMYCNIKQFDI